MPQWIEIVVRSFAIIIGLFLITKLLGKKQLSKLSFFEYIVGITVGDIAGTLSMDRDLNLTNGVTSILVWSLFPLVTSQISLRNKKFRDFVEGNATVFVRDGKILEHNLKKEKYTIDEFLEQLRKKDIFCVDDIEFATLESNGDLSVLLKKEKQPATYGDLHADAPEQIEPQTVIMDGEILDEPLAQIGLNRAWLDAELEKRNVLLDNVFLAQVNAWGEMCVDLYNDHIKAAPLKERVLTIVTLEKCISDLSFLSVTANSVENRAFYQSAMTSLEELSRKLRPLLKG
ncbi:DUF421 domain-containing protein [Sutcliffiella horikoshii]|uniref:DUF421 domain-containing protein n=1 Tax=Sutcliffiella horikoshii TaxID=79883 RepID=A0A5D4SUH5_9BACI|nr:DUF421 domain-containing protein [Sutcliffiella horikoshii]TYS65754.1 DUF421 domain-containing protein [Sutcliffiella horikoshii]